jgi:hypothetical protein
MPTMLCGESSTKGGDTGQVLTTACRSDSDAHAVSASGHTTHNAAFREGGAKTFNTPQRALLTKQRAIHIRGLNGLDLQTHK